MRTPRSATGGRPRRARLATAGVTLCGALAYALAAEGGGAAAAAPPSAGALYPALGSSGPVGLTFATAQQIEAASPSRSGPAWRSEPDAYGAGTPVPATIRRLPSTDREAASWIAESGEGGVCVMVSPTRRVAGVYPVGATCGEGQAALEHGIELTYIYPDSDAMLLAGVVPAGTSSVTVALADGTSASTSVSGDGWALTATSEPVSYTMQPSGETVTIGGE